MLAVLVHLPRVRPVIESAVFADSLRDLLMVILDAALVTWLVLALLAAALPGSGDGRDGGARR